LFNRIQSGIDSEKMRTDGSGNDRFTGGRLWRHIELTSAYINFKMENVK